MEGERRVVTDLRSCVRGNHPRWLLPPLNTNITRLVSCFIILLLPGDSWVLAFSFLVPRDWILTYDYVIWFIWLNALIIWGSIFIKFVQWRVPWDLWRVWHRKQRLVPWAFCRVWRNERINQRLRPIYTALWVFVWIWRCCLVEDTSCQGLDWFASCWGVIDYFWGRGLPP